MYINCIFLNLGFSYKRTLLINVLLLKYTFIKILFKILLLNDSI